MFTILYSIVIHAQVTTLSNPEQVSIKLEKISPALRDIKESTADMKSPRMERDNRSLERHMPVTNPHALPAGPDPALQSEISNMHSTTAATVLSNWAGLQSGSEPSDNSMAVGPNHVFQIINGTLSGSLIRLWDKSGNIIANSKQLKSILGQSDGGDINVLYDQQADRFVISTLSNTYSKIYVCVSQTPDPNGAYYVYSFTPSNGLPDYPKIAVWGDSYLITTNSNAPSIWVLNRSSLLVGQPIGIVQMFSLARFPTIGFQAASPITETGNKPPPASEPAMVIRVADDAWGSSIDTDRLELFQLSIDWTIPSNSTITGPINLPTIPYNSNLCGFDNFSCIPQPNSNTKLEPLSDVIMDKVQYRNFGDHEAIVCSHVCNATGTGVTGVRWYEMRLDNNDKWFIYQQGTYSFRTVNRWMSSISINKDGSIALGYNVSNSIVYPGIRLSGRAACDPLNRMTAKETNVQTGAASNISSRYGDYNGLVTDPSDGSFWFTSNYNPSASWATNIAHFTISNCQAINKKGNTDLESFRPNFRVSPVPADAAIEISFDSDISSGAPLQIFDITGKKVYEQMIEAIKGSNRFNVDLRNLKNGYYVIRYSNPIGAVIQKLVIQH